MLARSIFAAGLIALAGLTGCSGMNKTDCADCQNGTCTDPNCKAKGECAACKAGTCTDPNCAEKKAKSVSSVNNVCPIGGDEFDAKNVPTNLSRTYNGQTIGFCCEGCVGKFDNADAAGKGKILAEALAHKAG